MKKCIAIFLCLFALSVTVSAVDVSEYTIDDWIALYGIPEPQREDFVDDSSHIAAWDIWYRDLSNFINQRTQEENTRQAAEEAARQVTEGSPVESTPTKPKESAGTNDGNSGQTVDDDLVDKYPLGSYVDPSGAVWSPDGARLSPLSAEDAASAAGPASDAALSSEGAVVPAALSDPADPDTLAVIAGLVSDIAGDQPVWYVEDLRPADPPVTVLDGLKSLVTSIFGEYTPVTTTSVITETVGNETHQYLVETVAPGAAGVDYEWLAGVCLFGILLFCFMKLLGGVLK